MHKKSIWWLFFLLFGLTIGGIHSLGWWARQASAHTQAVHVSAPPKSQSIQVCEPKHWRSLVMQQ